MKILVTGAAGFIGYHLCNNLSKNKNIELVGVDNFDNYYDVNIKKNRIKTLKKNKKFVFYKVDINNNLKISQIFKKYNFNIVIHLAAQAGVRYSISNPSKYIKSNINGFFNIIDVSRKFKVKHFLFASTSSVYGNSKKFPLKEDLNTDKPLSIYAATKKSNEVLAYAYSNIFKIPCTALRFFTVYGPFGRPDMALYLFTKKMINYESIELFNKGNHIRDFTYIDDIILSITKLIKKPPRGIVPYEVYNLASSKPRKLKDFLETIKIHLGITKFKIIKLKMQKGDVFKTHADTNKLINKIKYKPSIGIEIGIQEFIKWFKKYYKYD